MSNIQRARRIPNANGQVLIENWVEERATEHIDHRAQQQDKNQSTSQSYSSPTTKKTAHTALLTQQYQNPLDSVTTYRDDYYKFGPFEQVEQGARRKRLEHELTRQVAAEFRAQKQEFEENLRRERIENSTSEYHTQFTKDFQSKPPPATQVISNSLSPFCLTINERNICVRSIFFFQLFELRKHFDFVYHLRSTY